MKNNLFLKQIFLLIIILTLFTFLLRIAIEHSTEIYGIIAYFGLCMSFGFLLGSALKLLEQRNYEYYRYKTLVNSIYGKVNSKSNIPKGK